MEQSVAVLAALIDGNGTTAERRTKLLEALSAPEAKVHHRAKLLRLLKCKVRSRL